MDYAGAVAAAPPGWRHFDISDLDRLPPAIRRRALARIPAGEMERVRAGDPAARVRAVRALFWTFVYSLAPERWHALASAEPIHPELLAMLPAVGRAVDVGAGSGRLTAHLVRRSGVVVAVEPAAPLARLLADQVPRALVVEAWAEELPLPAGWSELTVASAAFGAERAVLDEMRRVTAPGGLVALISPERPERFERLGWRRVSVDAMPPPAHDAWIDDFFGRPDPPREMVVMVTPGSSPAPPRAARGSRRTGGTSRR